MHPEVPQHILALHPDCQCRSLNLVAAGAVRSAGGLILIYVLRGDMSALVLPEGEAIERRDELWRSTCFEAFVRDEAGESYLEFNFAPAGYWAAYEFSGYRQGMRNADVVAPFIDQMRDDESVYFIVELTDGQLAGLAPDVPWRVGLSIVIEEASGAKSYWALAHPPGKPDFHHVDGFVVELP